MFRVVVPGGGTGRTTAFLGEQLNGTSSEIVYLDFSTRSMKIAQKQVEIRNLKSVIWIRSWIEGMPKLGIGRFDFSQCSGVLHHLKSPLIGLNILKDVLKDEGGMDIMVYAQLGRTGVYQMQELLKIINTGFQGISKELKHAKLVLNTIPKRNWFKKGEKPISDHTKMGDIEIYDALLHKRDVSFTIPKLYDWISVAGLYLTNMAHFLSRTILDSTSIIPYKTLQTRLTLMSIKRQQTVSEIIHGDIIKHSPYVSRISNPEAVFADPLNNLYIYGSPHGLREALHNTSNYVKLHSHLPLCILGKISYTHLHSVPNAMTTDIIFEMMLMIRNIMTC